MQNAFLLNRKPYFLEELRHLDLTVFPFSIVCLFYVFYFLSVTPGVSETNKKICYIV